jgi:hypothetical protein
MRRGALLPPPWPPWGGLLPPPWQPWGGLLLLLPLRQRRLGGALLLLLERALLPLLGCLPPLLPLRGCLLLLLLPRPRPRPPLPSLPLE